MEEANWLLSGWGQNDENPFKADWPWGIERLKEDFPVAPLYDEDPNAFLFTGAGVHFYLIDSGINYDHPEFAGRTREGFNSVLNVDCPAPRSAVSASGLLSGSVFCASSCGQCGGAGCSTFPGGSANCCSGSITSAAQPCISPDDVGCLVTDSSKECSDGSGHSSHVGGTVAGATRGVATQAIIHPVRVFDSRGRPNGAGGFQWAAAHFETLGSSARGVICASLGTPTGGSSSFDQTAKEAAAKGLFVAIAAGNSAKDACETSPARIGGANPGSASRSTLTVAASAMDDSKAFFSNYGRCIDIWAPEVQIQSADRTGSGFVLKSGTSMAAPHVAGAAILVSEIASAGCDALCIKNFLLEHAQTNVIHAADKFNFVEQDWWNRASAGTRQWLSQLEEMGAKDQYGQGADTSEVDDVAGTPNKLLDLPRATFVQADPKHSSVAQAWSVDSCSWYYATADGTREELTTNSGICSGTGADSHVSCAQLVRHCRPNVNGAQWLSETQQCFALLMLSDGASPCNLSPP